MKRIALLGATGSIGASTLDVVARHPGRGRVSALAAHRSVDALAALCAKFRPELAVIADPACESALRAQLATAGVDCRVASGSAALIEAASGSHCDTVVAAIVGAAGLESTLAAARAGKRLLLANKEAVVMAGQLLAAALAEGGGQLLPLDSEHNAVFQCLPRERAGLAAAGVRRILLTASGGPFRGLKAADLAEVTPERACAHPNWRMGRKISVDSATLMNKGLEVIEAHWLFAAAPERIEVVVHPQSIVHSLVEYTDGSVLAQLGNPDMRTALAHGLAWPERIEAGVAPLDLTALARLDFQAPDRAAFPCLDLAFRALRAGPAASTVLNAANEIAVSAFLQRRAAFLAIPDLIAACLDALAAERAESLDELLALDARARQVAEARLAA